ncbi:MAG: zf-HC2 domain-containing protein [Planctomycetota bacterium]
MNCAQCKEHLIEYIEDLLEDQQTGAIESHLDDCPNCRAEAARMTDLRKRLIQNGQTFAQTDLENAVFDQIVRSQHLKLKEIRKIDRQFNLWRIIMKSRITKFATAAAVILIAVLGITFLEKSAPTAYAIEQTIQASHSVRYLHTKSFIEPNDEPMEFWIEFDARGQLKNMRFHKPAWMDPEDGETIIVWKDHKMKLYTKRKNFLITMKDKEVADQVLKSIEQLDPKLAVENLKTEQEQGKVEVEIVEPSNKSEPIIVTVTNIEQDDEPFQRAILFVDQATRLVNSVEAYKLEDGEYQKVITTEYYDYNQPIASEMFTLDDVPDDAMRVDETTQEVGLLQGDLTDNEIAVEVVRRFLEALIEEDYAEAGRMFSGVPAERIKRTYGDTRFIRIISIGEPTKVPVMKALKVPCKIEIEEDGQVSVWEPEHSYVRQVHGQPERWAINGGFYGI